MKNLVYLFAFLLLLQFYACEKSTDLLIPVDEVSPWCILGFDSLDRSPEQRISMLKELGLSKYGFNRGKGEFDEMVKEFNLAKESDIEITSIFLWLNAKRDSIGKLGQSNQELLGNLRKVEQKPTIWVSFSNNFFEQRDEKESIEYATKMIKFVKLEADKLGCKLALYNHHGWFGNPYNQIKILKELNQDSITMVYNFHHAQDYVDEFSDIAKLIQPYLSYVNLNGVKKEGPQILTIGKGDYEYEMIKSLKAEGYDGPWGILGHIKTEDVHKVLKRNLDGLNALNTLYDKEEGK